ncbi:MAG TPA: hypothetical protein DCO77_13780 [Nitrospiraceae bacterium]|nr:hypothetical protein [Nitrospiraceae bacterium]
MELKIDIKSIEWWLWTVTLALLIAAVAGWTPGYLAVIIVSFAQIPYAAVRSRSIVSFASQVRIVYFGDTLFGLWPAARVIVYGALIVGTIMVVLFDHCGISMALARMPWNRGVNPQCKLP